MSLFPAKPSHPKSLRSIAAAILAAACLAFPTAGMTQAVLASDPATVLGEAERALSVGRAFRATRLLAPLLGTPAGREPAVLLLAARAAAGWEGWGTVVRLLAGQAWLDDLAGGDGRALLARAHVERAEPAVEDARRAVGAARGEALGPRMITLARAFDRADMLDSAAVAYLRAAQLLPAAAEWLRLRAAGVQADSTARAALYRDVFLPAAVPRIRWTEALALERSGNPLSAARIYEALGAPLAAVRLRVRAAKEPVELAAARRELVLLLAQRLNGDEAREAIGLLDEIFTPLTPDEELVVARRAAAFDAPRAAAGFARAARGHRLADADRLTYGGVLARLGRHSAAIIELGAIRSRELRAQAQYQSARSLLASGSRPQAIAALRRLARSPEGDTATAAVAGYLAADLLVDEGDENAARRAYLEVARRYPRSNHAPRAAFQAALLAWIHGDRRAAAKEFAALAERAGERSEGIAAMYWSGRTLLALGDSLGAAARWRTILARFPTSYYTLPAAEHLGLPPVPEPSPALGSPTDSVLLATLDRAAELDRVGLRVEARFEYERISKLAESAPANLLGTARAFFERGLLGRSYRLALRAPEGVTQRLAFPLPGTELTEEARRVGVDPLLAAALMRQESAFDPAARSAADARGLMQVLPSLGAAMARGAGISDWDPALLYQPQVNIAFGVAHLAQAVRQYPRLAVALAAYNAGDRVTARWLALPGADDPDVFIERIQFVETRDYVRRILRNLAVYRSYYRSLP